MMVTDGAARRAIRNLTIATILNSLGVVVAVVLAVIR